MFDFLVPDFGMNSQQAMKKKKKRLREAGAHSFSGVCLVFGLQPAFFFSCSSLRFLVLGILSGALLALLVRQGARSFFFFFADFSVRLSSYEPCVLSTQGISTCISICPYT